MTAAASRNNESATISAAEVERFKVERLDEISAAGTNRDLAALRFMLNFGVRIGHLQRNPVKGVRFLKAGPGCTLAFSASYTACGRIPVFRIETARSRSNGLATAEYDSVRAGSSVAATAGKQQYRFVPRGKTNSARRNIPLTNSEHKRRAIAKLEQFNTEQVIALAEKRQGPQSPHNRLGCNEDVLVNY